MIPLPSSCEGCPFYKYKDVEGNGFVPDVVVPGSTVYFIAQNPGADEVQGRRLIGGGYNNRQYEPVQPQPLIGATGKMFTERFLPLSGLQRSEVSLGNAIRCRPGLALGGQKADELPSITSTMRLDNPKGKADIVNAMKHCKAVHMHIPSTTRVVVTMGRHAMFALTGLARDEDEYHKKQGVLESWRGYAVTVRDYSDNTTVDTSSYHSLISGPIVYMTMHIAALFYGDNKRFYHATLQDFYKLKLLLAGQWPLSLPQWYSTAPQQWPVYSSFDTEYSPNDGRLYRWSMCDSYSNLYCVEADTATNGYIPLPDNATVLIQNALADIGYLSRIVQFDKVKIEDLMLAHSVLWPGEPHSLNYINSIYGTLNRYKHLSQGDPQMYSAMDAWEPMQMWRSYFIPEFKRDRESWTVYKRYRLPLISIINKAQQSGVRLDSSRLSDLQVILQQRLDEYRKRACEITGDPLFDLGGSKDMKGVLYG